MNYPLFMRFKIAAIASQIHVDDAQGAPVFYVKQKLFKLKENIEIYSDSSMQQKRYTVKADRVIDFSPVFTLTDVQGSALGAVQRFGKKSIFKATYEITIGNGQKLTIKEINPWAKVWNGIFSEIPFLGLLAGYVFHPRYRITSEQGQEIAELEKLPAFLESRYTITPKNFSLDEPSQQIFSALMMVVVLRERMRG